MEKNTNLRIIYAILTILSLILGIFSHLLEINNQILICGKACEFASLTNQLISVLLIT